MKISFTGHRDYRPEMLDRPLVEHIIEICGRYDEPVTFLCGMAVGFDMAAGEAVLEAKRRGAAVSLHCIIPFLGHDGNLSAASKSRYQALLERCESYVVLSDSYDKCVFHRRNDYLIERADLLIAYLDPAKKGGTAYTVRSASSLKKPVINLFPQPQLSLL